ncbi:MAG TPA: exo-alpha-sialidase, partial [Saprospiraceae bacterium]|nr:exo-alpha-sialidase [Saprospiraceae bacterium]
TMRLLCFILYLSPTLLSAQGGFPWLNPLMIAYSADGVQFGTPAVFQDSSGVPSALQWKDDTLICVFQWFRAPVGGPGWDRVAVKFSYDHGLTWTAPVPIVIDGFPPNYQRAFDPTLARLPDGRLRLYFSSSDGMPTTGLDATVNTYSAAGFDGIHYQFEPGARVDHPTNRVIDPAVIYFNNAWHYAAPIGAPQAGAYHYVSPDGLNFSPVPNIGSDPAHNWTGNYVLADDQTLRFYGSGPGNLWFNTSPNGGVWTGYTTTNLMGGDPTAVRLSDGYLIIYVGQPYSTPVQEPLPAASAFEVFPNPAGSTLYVRSRDGSTQDCSYNLYSPAGSLLQSGVLAPETTAIMPGDVAGQALLLQIICAGQVYWTRVLRKE